jgi:hypothetical protein
MTYSWQTEWDMEIDERVREAHLSHFCPGGASFPVTDSRPIGLDPGQAAPDRVLNGTPARATGSDCGRCGQPIRAGQDARRQASGTWVHESCPA